MIVTDFNSHHWNNTSSLTMDLPISSIIGSSSRGIIMYLWEYLSSGCLFLKIKFFRVSGVIPQLSCGSLYYARDKHLCQLNSLFLRALIVLL